MGFLEDRAGLTGKVALIAGGGGGLGRAVALDYARAGMHLVVCDKNEELLDQTVREIRDVAEEPLAALIDVRDADAFTTTFNEGVDRFGRLDVLVNVAGGTFKADFVDTNSRGWDAVIRANFGWLLHSTHLAAVQMRKQGDGGSIISITSIEGHRAAPGYAVYAGMKAAVTNFSRTLALELAPDGIRVNTIAPDQTPTEGMPMDYIAEVIQAGIPMGRQGTYEDTGNCALFLASDLSSYVTGTTLHPDGGAYASAGWYNWPGLGYVNNPPASAFEHGG
ncbi:MAG TPA: SDR family oxidoreductase [Acidimicrobiia bacterium]|jgi:3-oxoacyl-[acyl-carrier protein] reductase|nr:SDR family oxidoreductase [Acidimicrobiia bacterium]